MFLNSVIQKSFSFEIKSERTENSLKMTLNLISSTFKALLKYEDSFRIR